MLTSNYSQFLGLKSEKIGNRIYTLGESIYNLDTRNAIVKQDLELNVLNTFRIERGGYYPDREMVFRDMTKTDDNCLLLVGAYGTYLNAEYWYVKMDTLGNVVWSKELLINTYYESALTVFPLAGNEAIITGHTVEDFSVRRGFLLRIDENGDTLWTRYFTSKIDPMANVFIGEGVELPGGNILVNIRDAGRSGILVLDANGNLLDYRISEESITNSPLNFNSVSASGNSIFLVGSNQNSQAVAIGIDPSFTQSFGLRFSQLNSFNGVMQTDLGHIVLNGRNLTGPNANSAPIVLLNSSGVPLRSIVAGKMPSNSSIPFRAVQVDQKLLFTGYSIEQGYYNGYQIISDTLLNTGSCYSHEIENPFQSISVNWIDTSITMTSMAPILNSYGQAITNPTANLQTHFSYQIDNVLFRDFEIIGDDCGGSCSGMASVTVAGGAPPYSIEWGNGSLGSVATGLCFGDLPVLIGDDFGCFFRDTIIIGSYVNQQDVCMVSVDTSSTKNVVFWEKQIAGNIEGYKIYRDVVGNYTLTGYVPYDSLSLFIDNTAGINPNITSYRYKIAVLDTCGNESVLSDFHKTIHLTNNLGVAGEVNLIWDGYQGISGSFYYRILRDTLGNGSFHVLDSVSNSNFTYTDYSPSVNFSPTYIIEVVFPYACSSIRAVNNNSTRSNRSQSGIQANFINEKDASRWSVFPNPTEGELIIQVDPAARANSTLGVFSAVGISLYSFDVTSERMVLNLRDLSLPPGLYFISLFSVDGERFTQRIILTR